MTKEKQGKREIVRVWKLISKGKRRGKWEILWKKGLSDIE